MLDDPPCLSPCLLKYMEIFLLFFFNRERIVVGLEICRKENHLILSLCFDSKHDLIPDKPNSKHDFLILICTLKRSYSFKNT